MSNLEVIKKFLNKETGKTPTRKIQGVFEYMGETLKSTGYILINYNTIIARHEEGILFINMQKYSRTTGKIQNMLLNEAAKMGLKIEQVNYDL